MSPAKSIDRTNALKATIPASTLWAYVRAAIVANLIVVTQVLIAVVAPALGTHDGEAFHMASWLIPFVTLVVWTSAALFYLVPLASRRFGTLGRRFIGPARSSPSGRSGVWDDWLDSPEPRHP